MVPVGADGPTGRAKKRQAYRRMTEDEMCDFIDRLRGRILAQARDADLARERYPRSSRMRNIGYDLGRAGEYLGQVMIEAQRWGYDRALAKLARSQTRTLPRPSSEMALWDVYQDHEGATYEAVCNSWFRGYT